MVKAGNGRELGAFLLVGESQYYIDRGVDERTGVDIVLMDDAHKSCLVKQGYDTVQVDKVVLQAGEQVVQ